MVTEKRLRWLLEKRYGCVYDGKELPTPYCDEDDMPTFYIAPSGLHFTVPPPPDGVKYKVSAVEAIVKAGQLNTVVKMGGKRLSLEDLLKDAPDDIDETASA